MASGKLFGFVTDRSCWIPKLVKGKGTNIGMNFSLYNSFTVTEHYNPETSRLAAAALAGSKTLLVNSAFSGW